MGYWLDGEIVITGRAKDLILLNGRNIWPQDIEWAVEQLDAVRSGDVAAFAVETDDGEDKVIVLVQCRASDAQELAQLRGMAAAACARSPASIAMCCWSRRAPCLSPRRKAVAFGCSATLPPGSRRRRGVASGRLVPEPEMAVAS